MGIPLFRTDNGAAVATAYFNDAWGGGNAFPYARRRQDQDTIDLPVDEDSDQALIYACLSKDHNSFKKLVDRYEAAVARILWPFTRDRLVLEELVQDTFVEAYFSLRRFRRDAPFFPWLRIIATRVGYGSWRKQRRERERKALLAQWRPEAFWTQTSQKPSDTAEYVYHTLELLGPKDRLVLTLQYFGGCNTNEIAERMGWTPAMVKIRAFRARKRLKALLLETEHTGHD